MAHRVKGPYELQKYISVEHNILSTVMDFLIKFMFLTLRITKRII